MKKIILAYSGGLDTSCAVKWLNEQGYTVICFVANLGQGLDFEEIQTRGLAAGAAKVLVKDLQDEFINDYIIPALKANAIYEDKYLLATALGRPLIAQHLVEIAHKEKADAVAHGCTGKGNDQVRFEVSIGILDPGLDIIAPLREWEFGSREEEVEYAKLHDIPLEVTKKKLYSIDRNIWGVSIESGPLEDLGLEPPQDAYLITKGPSQLSTYPRYIEVSFKKGIPEKIDAKSHKLKNIINLLNEIGGTYGIGRTDLIEDRLVGIKTREVYEAPAATILHLAHRELESLVLDKDTLNFKKIVSLKYAELIYNGLWFTPLREGLDKFVESTQKRVSGSVKLKLFKANCTAVARKSNYSRYKKELATYGKGDKFNPKLAKGFIEIWGMPYKR